MKKAIAPRRRHHGFTLIELTIVLVIFTFLISGMLLTLSTQQDNANRKETGKQLSEIREALIGFAAAYGRLPCPATEGATGIENPVGGGVCATNYAGFVPAITLGVSPTNAEGYAVDAWGNPIRYAVTWVGSNTFTKANDLKTRWASGTAPTPDDIRVCSTPLGISGSGNSATCADNKALTNSTVAILVSAGKNGGTLPVSLGEIANSGVSRAFVSHAPTVADSSQGEFDDIVIWLSPNILYNRMITAGRLP